VSNYNPDSLAELVTAKTKASGTSFYWAMRLLEPRRRLAMYAIYAFCRDVDDIVDEPGTDDEKSLRLALWEEDIRALYHGAQPTQKLAAALRPAILTYTLPMADFLAVIDGCRMDLGPGQVRPTMLALDLYCDRVASAVGRLSVRVFGDFVPDCLVLANHQGRALQLTNILRDVVVDAKIGRLYLPDELLCRHGIVSLEIEEILAHPALPAVCAELAEIAGQHFELAREALKHCSARAVRPGVVMMEMYWQIYLRLQAIGWRPQAEPVKLPKLTKLWCAVRHGVLA
jgi:phytoene synthase